MQFNICNYHIDECPTIKKLQKFKVIVNVSNEWIKLGIELLDEGHQQAKLKNIKSDNDNDETCCREMFEFWLKTHVNVTWYNLVDSLRAVQMLSVAKDLEERFNGLCNVNSG